MHTVLVLVKQCDKEETGTFTGNKLMAGTVPGMFLAAINVSSALFWSSSNLRREGSPSLTITPLAVRIALAETE